MKVSQELKFLFADIKSHLVIYFQIIKTAIFKKKSPKKPETLSNRDKNLINLLQSSIQYPYLFPITSFKLNIC